MASQPPQQPMDNSRKLKVLYWIAAAAMAVAGVLELIEKPDYLKATSRLALLVVLIMLATARPAETRAKKMLIYALLILAIGLFVARLFAR